MSQTTTILQEFGIRIQDGILFSPKQTVRVKDTHRIELVCGELTLLGTLTLFILLPGVRFALIAHGTFGRVVLATTIVEYFMFARGERDKIQAKYVSAKAALDELLKASSPKDEPSQNI